MSVLEAMAYGKPVVGSDIGGIPELVVHGETGLPVSAGRSRGATRHSLLQLMENPELRSPPRPGGTQTRRGNILRWNVTTPR